MPNESGEPLRPQYVTRLFETMRRAANTGMSAANVERVEGGEQSHSLLSEMRLHGLRHMHASLLRASGADIALVSKRLGHSSISITSDIYTHLIGDAARRAAEGASALVPRASAQRVHNEPAGAGMTKAPETRIAA